MVRKANSQTGQPERGLSKKSPSAVKVNPEQLEISEAKELRQRPRAEVHHQATQPGMPS